MLRYVRPMTMKTPLGVAPRALRAPAVMQVPGVTRFRDRVYQLARRGAADVEMEAETLTILHKTMKKVRMDVPLCSDGVGGLAALCVRWTLRR